MAKLTVQLAVQDVSEPELDCVEQKAGAKCTVRVSKHHCTQTFRGVRHPHGLFLFGVI